MVLEIIENWMLSNTIASIIVISFIITLVMTLVTKKFTDQARMKELKQIQKACNIKMKANKDNLEEMKKIQGQMMECSMELMKHSFKPLLITMIPLLFLFWWLKGVYEPVLSGWIWWYIGASIISSIALRKVLDVV